MNKIKYTSPDGLWGHACTYTKIDDEGKMWVGNDEYETQVNYCPWTGEPAPKQMKLEDVELWSFSENKKGVKKLFKQYVNKSNES
jgi:hypothetical protein